MGEWISYQQKPLGRLKLSETGKFIYVSESLDSLIELFSINPDDEIETESFGKMKFKEFKRDYLGKISCFYTTFDEWLLKNEHVRSLDEYKERVTS